MNEPFKLTLPKEKIIPIIDLLKDFEKMCIERGIKFNQFSEDQLMEILTLYKRYRADKNAPF